MKIKSWTKAALEIKAEKSGKFYLDLLFLYDVGLIDIEWVDGEPMFYKIKK